jgi:hypothetical protein
MQNHQTTDGPGNDRSNIIKLNPHPAGPDRNETQDSNEQPGTVLDYIDDRLTAWERYPDVKTLGELEARLAEERRETPGK